MAEFKRPDGRGIEEMRPVSAKVGIVPNANGSAMFQSGKTIAIAAVYGPKKMHPQHQQDPATGQLRCNYNMLSFSVDDRIRPGRNRRAMEISEITKWALEPALILDDFQNQVIDVFVYITQADAGTRCAGINAASMALAQAGIPMKNLVTSVSVGKLDKQLVLDLTKEEEDFEEGEGPTDIPVSMTPNGDITHLQLDGKIGVKQLQEAMDMAKKGCQDIYEVQKKALKESVGGDK
jgi:exosome complex component RRP41